MRPLESYNPIVIAIYIIAVSTVAVFCMNPLLLSTSLFGALAYYIARNGASASRLHVGALALFSVMSLINPLVSHNGVTVLFVLNDNPITLEATLYGVVSAMMIVAVLYWFSIFTQIMTSDKLLYLFGKLSPKLSLILSMALRYVPLFGRQAKKINNAGRAMGLYKEDNVIDRSRGRVRVFSSLVTWSLENGIVTADSMSARGYGLKKRRHFSIFRLRSTDVAMLSVTLALTALTCTCLALGALDFEFYPTVKQAPFTWISAIGVASYAVLVMLPTFIELEERLKWRYLKSKI